MTGPLTGTASASASRYSVVAKSPQTGVWGQANSGGSFGPALKKSGYDGIIFEGASPEPVILQVIDGKPELKDATHLWGKTVPETEDALQDSASHKLTVAAIGPITVPMAQAGGVHPWTVGFATAFASSFAHLLIIGTPSNALVYAMSKDPLTGRQLVRQKDFLKHGLAILAISFVVLWFWTFLGYWRWLGFPEV